MALHELMARHDAPGTPGTVTEHDRAVARTLAVQASPRVLDFGPSWRSLTDAARAPETAERLEQCGYVVLPLKPTEAALVRRAGAAADRSFAPMAAAEGPAGKQILTLRRSPMDALMTLLMEAATLTLDGVCKHLGLPQDAGRALLKRAVDLESEEEDEEEDASLFSAMLSPAPDANSAAPACDEHEDRGLLTFITGQSAPTIEVFNRTEGRWVRPMPDADDTADPTTYVVVLVGASLHRLTGGLTPSTANGEVGATRHRVPTPAVGEARRSLVLRLRAQPDRRFACEPLRGRPGAVQRFIDGTESVAEFYASKNYTSVNHVPAMPSAAASTSAPTIASLPSTSVPPSKLDSGQPEASEPKASASPAGAPGATRINLNAEADDDGAIHVLEALETGEAVIVAGLVQAVSLNGAMGMVLGPPDEHTGRYQIRLSTGTCKRIKRVNLQGRPRRFLSARLCKFFGAQIGIDAAGLVQQHGAATHIQMWLRRCLLRARIAAASEIELLICTQDGENHPFCCRPDEQLNAAMMAFCERNGIHYDSARFLFDGQRLRPDATPKGCDMEPGDIIDVMIEQWGD